MFMDDNVGDQRWFKVNGNSFYKEVSNLYPIFPQMHLEIQAHLNLASTNIPNMGTGTHEHVHKCRLAHAKSNLRVLGEFFSPRNPNP